MPVRRWVAILAIVAVALTGCDNAEEREAALKKELYKAVEAVPGLEEYHVRTRASGDGFAVDAEVRLAPAAGQAAAGAKLVRAALTGSDEVRSVSLTLVLRRGAAEHDGRWYDGTAARPEFDRQADLWGRTVDSGSYRRVLAMMQSTQRFKVAAQGWTGDAASRPSAARAYRDLVAAGVAAGLRIEDLDLSAAPTDRVEAGSDGGAALPDAVLAAGEQVAKLDGVGRVTITGRSTAPAARMRIYPVKPLSDGQRGQIRDTLRRAGLLGPGLEVIEGGGEGRPI